MLARDDLGQEVALLGLGAALDDGVADHRDAEAVVVAADGDPRLRELLGHDDALDLAEPGAAVLGRPRHRQQLVLRQQGPPFLHELVAGVFVERSHAAPVGWQVLGQEGLDLLAVVLGLFGVGGIHRCAPLLEIQLSSSLSLPRDRWEGSGPVAAVPNGSATAGSRRAQWFGYGR